jgi:saxitoxin biosynthesis operon SxtJ-like protein
VTAPAKKLRDRDRQFGLAVGTVLLLLAPILVWRGRILTAEILGGIGAVLVVLGRFAPRLLKYPSAVWWKVAMVLGYVNARIILTVIFAIVLVPLGVVWRILGRDPLARHRANWPGWSPYPERYRNRAHYTRMY